GGPPGGRGLARPDGPGPTPRGRPVRRPTGHSPCSQVRRPGGRGGRTGPTTGPAHLRTRAVRCFPQQPPATYESRLRSRYTCNPRAAKTQRSVIAAIRNVASHPAVLLDQLASWVRRAASISARVDAPSFWRILATWCSTVLGEM